MALARVITFTLDGVEARRVWVEADIRSGLPAFSIVGLADKAVREARERVRAAVTNAGYVFPEKRITVNLAPAYLRKVGAAFDLPVAIAVLAASGQLDARRGRRAARDRRRALALRRGPPDARCAGDGRGRPACRASAGCCVPRRRAAEAALVPEVEVLGVETLQEAVEVLRGQPGARGRSRRPAGGRPRARRARPRRRPRPQRARPCARGRGGRRPQPLPARPARHRQDHARPAASLAAAADDGGRGDRGHPARLDRRPARRAASSAGARSARRTTPSPPPVSSAAGVRRCRARRRSPTTASSSSTSSPSSSARRSRRCASRWRTAG